MGGVKKIKKFVTAFLMLAYIKGTILKKAEKFLVVFVSGLGYKVFAKESDVEKIKAGEEIELHLFHYIREDANSLYGFKTLQELEMFELLLSVSGIGPKAGLGILNLANVEQIKKAVISGDSSILTRVSGIGKKTAERVILELKNKIDASSIEDIGTGMASELDAIDALIGLGYSRGTARDALDGIDKNLDTSERIKKALAILGKK